MMEVWRWMAGRMTYRYPRGMRAYCVVGRFEWNGAHLQLFPFQCDSKHPKLLLHRPSMRFALSPAHPPVASSSHSHLSALFRHLAPRYFVSIYGKPTNKLHSIHHAVILYYMCVIHPPKANWAYYVLTKWWVLQHGSASSGSGAGQRKKMNRQTRIGCWPANNASFSYRQSFCGPNSQSVLLFSCELYYFFHGHRYPLEGEEGGPGCRFENAWFQIEFTPIEWWNCIFCVCCVLKASTGAYQTDSDGKYGCEREECWVAQASHSQFSMLC